AARDGETAVSHAEGLRARFARGTRTICAAGQSECASGLGEGTGGTREGAAWKAELRIRRERDWHSSRGRAVQDDRWRKHRAPSVQGSGPGPDAAAGKRSEHDVHRTAARAAARESRKAEGPRDRRREALT